MAVTYFHVVLIIMVVFFPRGGKESCSLTDYDKSIGLYLCGGVQTLWQSFVFAAVTFLFTHQNQPCSPGDRLTLLPINSQGQTILTIPARIEPSATSNQGQPRVHLSKSRSVHSEKSGQHKISSRVALKRVGENMREFRPN